MKLMKMAPTFGPARQDFERLFDRFFERPFAPAAGLRTFEPLWEPTLDFSETPKEYVVRLEVPGMARDDLDVAVDGTLLTLSGKRELHKEGKGEDFLWTEREEGRFMRTIRLPAAVQEGKIEAGYTDGILTVRLPKMEQPARTKVLIK